MNVRTVLMAASLAIGILGGVPALAQDSAKPAAPAAQATVKPLTVGDKAPEFKVESWIKGEPIKGFEKGKVYVVEFWATWCGPCVKAFPHLSEVQKEYKDKGVTIIGTNIWERGYSESTLGTIKEFVAKQGDKMAYTVAYDGGAKAMDQAFMKAAGQNGIPCAFIIDKEGRVAFIGHPMQMDEPLKAIVAGNFDLEKAKAEYEAEQALERDRTALMGEANAFGKAIRAKDFAKASELGRKLVDGKAGNDPMFMNMVAWSIVDPAAKIEKKDMDLDLAMKAANKAAEASKHKDPAILDTLARVQFVKGDIAKAIETQTKAIELAPAEMKGELEGALKEYKDAKK